MVTAENATMTENDTKTTSWLCETAPYCKSRELVLTRVPIAVHGKVGGCGCPAGQKGEKEHFKRVKRR